MQNKKTLLQRLLVIYITFFIVLVASIAHSVLTDFTRGAAEGVELGEDIAEKWSSGTPRMIYMLDNIRITETPDDAIRIASDWSSRSPRPAHRLSRWRSARSAAADGFTRWCCSDRSSTP